jgi:hypothetical protein
VAVTSPWLAALTPEDLEDGINYAGLRSWLSRPVWYPRQLIESHTVFAGNGNGLCRNYKDVYECNDEEDYMPSHMVYFVS